MDEVRRRRRHAFAGLAVQWLAGARMTVAWWLETKRHGRHRERSGKAIRDICTSSSPQAQCTAQDSCDAHPETYTSNMKRLRSIFIPRSWADVQSSACHPEVGIEPVAGTVLERALEVALSRGRR